MIRVLGGPKRLCDGLTRRDLLHVGSLGLLGLGLLGHGPAGPRPAARAPRPLGLPGFGQAKSCILLFMYGSPSQIETFDPKPDAPVEIRGELGCIPSSVPGLNVCERLPNLAQVMDKVTLIRSVSHPYPIHGVAYATTGNPGRPARDGAEPARSAATGRSSARWSITSTASERRRARRDVPTVPRNLVLPWAFSSQRVGEVPARGPVRRVPRPGLRPDLHRVRRPGHAEGHQDAARR